MSSVPWEEEERERARRGSEQKEGRKKGNKKGVKRVKAQRRERRQVKRWTQKERELSHHEKTETHRQSSERESESESENERQWKRMQPSILEMIWAVHACTCAFALHLFRISHPLIPPQKRQTHLLLNFRLESSLRRRGGHGKSSSPNNFLPIQTKQLHSPHQPLLLAKQSIARKKKAREKREEESTRCVVHFYLVLAWYFLLPLHVYM